MGSRESSAATRIRLSLRDAVDVHDYWRCRLCMDMWIRTIFSVVAFQAAIFTLAAGWIGFGEVDMSLFGTGEDLMHVNCIPYMSVPEPRPALEAVTVLPSWAERWQMVVGRYTRSSGKPRYHPTMDGLWKYVAADGYQYSVSTPLTIGIPRDPVSFEVELQGSAESILPGGHFDTVVYLHQGRPGDQVLMCFKRTCEEILLPAE